MAPRATQSPPNLPAKRFAPPRLLDEVSHNLGRAVAPPNRPGGINDLLTCHQDFVGQATVVTIRTFLPQKLLGDPRILDFLDDVHGVCAERSSYTLNGPPKRLRAAFDIEGGPVPPVNKHRQQSVCVPNLAFACHSLDHRVAREGVYYFHNGVLLEDRVTVDEHDRMNAGIHSGQLKSGIQTLAFPAMRLRHTNVAGEVGVDCGPLCLVDDIMKQWADEIYECHSALFLGRGLHSPIAYEGALKLKEISYIHAEGISAGELKHGPLALLNKPVPVIVSLADHSCLDKLLSNIDEVLSRGAKVFVITEQHIDIKERHNLSVVRVPFICKILSPIIHIIPMQLLSYHVAVKLGRNVDRPPMLAKSVTVE